jgi:CHAT domain-containing protein
MSHFYAELARRLPKSEALRRAKLALRTAGYPSSAWAGFLLAGDDTPFRAG